MNELPVMSEQEAAKVALARRLSKEKAELDAKQAKLIAAIEVLNVGSFSQIDRKRELT